MSFPVFPLILGLAEFLPFVGRLIKGEKREEIAHKVVNLAQAVTGEKDAPQIVERLKGDPEILLRFQQEILQLEQELDLAEHKDRDSARLRDIAFANAGRSNLRADIMVIAAAFGLITCLVTITLYRVNLSGEAVGIISTIAGIFGSCLKDAYAFEFGSSRGSKIKDGNLSAFFLSK